MFRNGRAQIYARKFAGWWEHEPSWHFHTATFKKICPIFTDLLFVRRLHWSTRGLTPNPVNGLGRFGSPLKIPPQTIFRRYNACSAATVGRSQLRTRCCKADKMRQKRDVDNVMWEYYRQTQDVYDLDLSEEYQTDWLDQFWFSKILLQSPALSLYLK